MDPQRSFPPIICRRRQRRLLFFSLVPFVPFWVAFGAVAAPRPSRCNYCVVPPGLLKSLALVQFWCSVIALRRLATAKSHIFFCLLLPQSLSDPLCSFPAPSAVGRSSIFNPKQIANSNSIGKSHRPIRFSLALFAALLLHCAFPLSLSFNLSVSSFPSSLSSLLSRLSSSPATSNFWVSLFSPSDLFLFFSPPSACDSELSARRQRIAVLCLSQFIAPVGRLPQCPASTVLAPLRHRPCPTETKPRPNPLSFAVVSFSLPAFSSLLPLPSPHTLFRGLLLRLVSGMDGSPLLAAGGGASLSPTSPVSVRSIAGLNGAKRKRSAGGPASQFDSSPGSVLNDDDGDQSEKKRQPGVKRACNECRQQKVNPVTQRPHGVHPAH